MELYGKGPKPINDDDGSFIESPKGFTSRKEWLKWAVATGRVDLIEKEKLRWRKLRTQFVAVPGYIAMISNDILNGNDKLVLSDVVGFHENNLRYFRTNQGIAEWLGLSVDGVRNILRKLLKKNLIEKVIYSNQPGQSVRYILPLIARIKSLSEFEGGCDTHHTGV